MIKWPQIERIRAITFTFMHGLKKSISIVSNNREIRRCCFAYNYSRLSLSGNRRDPQKHFEISVLRHVRSVVLREKQFDQPNFTNDNVN